MIIKHSIQYSLKPRYSKGVQVYDNLQIRMRISYAGIRVVYYIGYSIDDEKWDKEAQRVKKGYYTKKKESYYEINSHLNKAAYEIDEAFKAFELSEKIPTPAELIDEFEKRMRAGNEKPSGNSTETNEFWQAYERFIKEESTKNSWQYSTVQKFKAFGNHLKAYKKKPRFDDFNSTGMTRFLSFLRSHENLSNRTIAKQLGYLKWFLKWARVNKYHNVTDYESYKPKLVTTEKKVIFLTIEEIKQVISAEIPPDKKYLERVRDVFLFCCFTGLRHSDVYNLRKSDIKTETIEITTIKTADSIVIDLNNVSKAIISKYKDCTFPENRALPVISNQKMNDYIKELCMISGLDEEIRETTYRGSERIDTVSHKWELVTTHTGRKSFICNALAQGVPVNIVMKWTGHSDYKALRPYVDAANSIMAREMHKMDNLIEM